MVAIQRGEAKLDAICRAAVERSGRARPPGVKLSREVESSPAGARGGCARGADRACRSPACARQLGGNGESRQAMTV
jgi:hypothetical protein